ncbi:MAG: nucleotidyltransferase family protein [Candidatus Riflebacteria bacterium]|nr:nucleotidyltransferase family protein [Candidatus Riflebacteria bacterium]
MLDALVLLAGFSTRMGQLKQHTMLADSTFLELVIRKLSSNRKHLRHLLFVGQSEDAESQKLVKDNGGIWLVNPNPELGPLSSIRIAIEQSSGDTGKLIWPVDHPMISTTTVNKLIALWQENTDMIVVPSSGSRRGHPTIFPGWCCSEFSRIELNEGAKKILQLYPDRIKYLLTDDIWVMKNLNTPQLLAEANDWLRTNQAR